MTELRFAMFGAGFWANYQLAAWGEIPGVRCVAICDPDRERAEKLAHKFSVASVYDRARGRLRGGAAGFRGYCLGGAHPRAARAPVGRARRARDIPEANGHEPGRSRAARGPLPGRTRSLPGPRELAVAVAPQRIREILDSGAIGAPFRARIDMISGFPVFVNQPALRTLEQFLLLDMGSHILDLARFLFGEAEEPLLSDSPGPRRHPRGGRGDCHDADGKGSHVSRLPDGLRRECPRTRLLSPDLGLHRGRPRLAGGCAGLLGPRDDGGGDRLSPPRPPRYAWADPAYEVVHASLVPCLANLLEGIRGGAAETTAEDNLRTVRLIFAAYESAQQ